MKKTINRPLKGQIPELQYLENKPKYLYWQVVATGRKVDSRELRDLVYDERDLKIRGIDPKLWKDIL